MFKLLNVLKYLLAMAYINLVHTMLIFYLKEDAHRLLIAYYFLVL